MHYPQMNCPDQTKLVDGFGLASFIGLGIVTLIVIIDFVIALCPAQVSCRIIAEFFPLSMPFIVAVICLLPLTWRPSSDSFFRRASPFAHVCFFFFTRTPVCALFFPTRVVPEQGPFFLVGTSETVLFRKTHFAISLLFGHRLYVCCFSSLCVRQTLMRCGVF